MNWPKLCPCGRRPKVSAGCYADTSCEHCHDTSEDSAEICLLGVSRETRAQSVEAWNERVDLYYDSRAA